MQKWYIPFYVLFFNSVPKLTLRPAKSIKNVFSLQACELQFFNIMASVKFEYCIRKDKKRI